MSRSMFERRLSDVVGQSDEALTGLIFRACFGSVCRRLPCISYGKCQVSIFSVFWRLFENAWSFEKVFNKHASRGRAGRACRFWARSAEPCGTSYAPKIVTE